MTRYIFAFLIIVSIWERHMKHLNFLAYILILAVLLLSFKLVVRYYVLQLTQILLKDCDCKKFLNVILDYNKQNDEQHLSKTMDCLCATAFFYNGNNSETHCYLKDIFSTYKIKQKELLKYILASSYYYENKESLKHSQIVHLFDYQSQRFRHKYFKKKDINRIKMILTAKELALDQNYQSAKELFLELYNSSTYPFEKVIFSMHLAEMHLGLEEMSHAKTYLEYVLENGNNLIAVTKANQLLQSNYCANL